jgi:hypothetical protein
MVLLLICQMIYEYGQPWWNDIDRADPKNSEKNLSQCHFVHQNSHMDRPRCKPGLFIERPAANCLNHGMVILCGLFFTVV